MASFLLVAALVACGHGHNHNGMTHRKNIWELNSCTDRLSPGPADADVEFQLSGLPASTTDMPVHLSFWTTRKSPTEYNPLESAVNCSVYSSMLYAYPKYSAMDFNGGNVRVSENGTATIRIGAPSTYFVWRWLAVPHVNLRLCRGNDELMGIRPAVMLAAPDVWISPAGTGYNITGSSYTPSTIPSPMSEDPDPVAVIVAVETKARSTTMAATVASTTLAATVASTTVGTTMTKMTTGQSTTPDVTATMAAVKSTSTPDATTTMAPTSTMLPSTTPASTTFQKSTTVLESTATPESSTTAGTREVMLQAARDALDTRALAFSPVYACLLEDKFYDHYSDDCITECLSEAVAKDGQCVRKETADPAADFFQEFQLMVACNEECWQNTKNASLHTLRLAAAGRLDIPFQEVMVKFGWEMASTRRLTASGEVRAASVKLIVASNRITTEQGSSLITALGTDKMAMSEALALPVESTRPITTQVSLSDETTMDKSNDPYSPAYDAAVPKARNAGPVASPLDGLPTGVIVAIAIGVLFLAVCFAGCMMYRRRYATRAEQQSQQDAKVAKQVKVAEEAPQQEEAQQGAEDA